MFDPFPLQLSQMDVRTAITKARAYFDSMKMGFWIFQKDNTLVKQRINEMIDIHADDSLLETERLKSRKAGI